MTETKQILIIGYVWPEPESSAAGSRMMQLVERFRSAGWTVSFACAASRTEHSADLPGIDQFEIDINSPEFNSLVRSLDPSLVLFDRFVTEEQFGWRVAEECPGALRVLDLEDLHCLRKARRQAVRANRDFREVELLEEERAMREVASIYRCDLALVISEFELELIRRRFEVDKSLLLYLPYMLDPVEESAVSRWRSFDSREHFVTIGNFRHAPNRDAVRYLAEEIWPEIRKRLPDARLDIYGAYPQESMTGLHQPGIGFHIRGRAEDAEEVVGRARVLLAPLRFGAGLKGKLIESMQHGTPSVTTRIGAEGIPGEMPWNGVIADTAGEFIAGAVKLYTDREAWREAQENGIHIINERFSKDTFGTRLTDRIGRLRDKLETHRRNNFTGSMLMHHTMASTKFMGRWIEEKSGNGEL